MSIRIKKGRKFKIPTHKGIFRVTKSKKKGKYGTAKSSTGAEVKLVKNKPTGKIIVMTKPYHKPKSVRPQWMKKKKSNVDGPSILR